MGFFNRNKPEPVPDESVVSNRIICWFEIPATDFHRAIDFYTNVLQLKIEETSFNDIPHGIIKSGSKNDQVNGAIMESKSLPLNPTGAVLFFNVNGKLDETIAKIPLFGGKILKEKTLIKNKEKDGLSLIPKTLIDGKEGYFCYFSDSEGNKMGLYANS
jgi:uncharacterized protein